MPQRVIVCAFNLSPLSVDREEGVYRSSNDSTDSTFNNVKAK